MSGRRRLSATARVALSAVLVLAAGVALVAGIAYTSVARNISTDLDASLLREIEAYDAAIAPSGLDDERTLVDASRSYLQRRTAASTGQQPVLLVRFADGRVLSNSGLALENAPGNSALLDPEGAARGFADVRLERQDYRVAVAPIGGTDGNTVAVFEAALPEAQSEAFLSELAVSLGLAGLVVLSVGAVLSVWIARRSLSPITRMAATAAEVTHSSLGERVEYDGPPDELGTLAAALNEMLERLEAAFGEQRRFVADASHELRTPVAVIRGNLDILSQTWASPEMRAESLRIVDDEVRRMQRMLDDLLSLARTHAGTRRPFQLLEVVALLAEAVAKGRSLGERTFSLNCDETAWVVGDPDLLEQAILNIVRNAVEHTQPGDSISLSCETEEDAVLLRISDTGPGIPEADLARVFDRFYRGRGPRPTVSGGSGLGLAISQRLVEMHGGRITASNAPGGGAMFTVELPRVRPHEDRVGAAR